MTDDAEFHIAANRARARNAAALQFLSLAIVILAIIWAVAVLS